MAPSNTGAAGSASEIARLAERLARVEEQQKSLESDFSHLQHTSENQGSSIKSDYVTKTEFALQMENLRLVIDLLKTDLGAIGTRLAAQEANILNEFKQVTERQQAAQATFRNRIIAFQSAVILLIMSGFVSYLVWLLQQHPH